jgi:hypothetical protein
MVVVRVVPTEASGRNLPARTLTTVLAAISLEWREEKLACSIKSEMQTRRRRRSTGSGIGMGLNEAVSSV